MSAPAVALLGLGEAGSRLAADLVAAGAAVHGFDPDASRGVDGIERAGSAVYADVNPAAPVLKRALAQEVTSTAERSTVVNRAVGGMNPLAVEIAARVGALSYDLDGLRALVEG